MAPEERNDGVDGPASPIPAGRWGQERRLEFIEYRLRWSGRLNRSDLTSFFGISVPQSSLDLAEYARRAPRNLVYDKSARGYVAGDQLEPVFPSTNHERYLHDLLQDSSAEEPHFESFLGWHPPVASTPVPGRALNGNLVATIVRAIREKLALHVTYQSMTRPEPHDRRLTPHALAHDGQRWHVRAYCHERQEFRDFVVTRILEVKASEQDRPRDPEDHMWHRMARLVLAPHPELPKAQRRAIELEYGMVDGRLEFQCREALFLYVLRQLRLDCRNDVTAKVQHIVLQNRSELEPLLRNIQLW